VVALVKKYSGIGLYSSIGILWFRIAVRENEASDFTLMEKV